MHFVDVASDNEILKGKLQIAFVHLIMTIIIGITIRLVFASFGDVFMLLWNFWFVELHVNLFEQQGEFNSEDDDDDDDEDD